MVVKDIDPKLKRKNANKDTKIFLLSYLLKEFRSKHASIDSSGKGCNKVISWYLTLSLKFYQRNIRVCNCKCRE